MVNTYLEMLIEGNFYRLQYTSPEPSLALTAWRLKKMPDMREIHDVRLTPEGKCECTCGDYSFRKQRRGGDCKHIEALRQVNLLPSK